MKKINYALGLDNYGRFNPEVFFVNIYNEFCNKLTIRLDAVLDLIKFDEVEFRSHYKDCFAIKRSSVQIFEKDDMKVLPIADMSEKDIESFGDEAFFMDDVMWIGDNSIEEEMYLFFDRLFISVSPRSVTVYSSLSKIEIREKLFSVLKFFVKKEMAPKALDIKLVCFDDGYYTQTVPIQEMHYDADNYNDDFEEVREKIVQFLDPENKETGIIMLNGSPGTGKTSYVRSLVAEHPNNYMYITPTIAARMSEPEFTSYLLGHKNSVFVLEDCEQIVLDRENSSFGSSVASLLNMSDGIMGDIFNGKFICTYNTNVDNIDKALLRPGRCMAQYEFGKLEKSKAIALLKKVHNLSDEEANKICPEDGMPLADIYYYKSRKKVEKKSSKLGF